MRGVVPTYHMARTIALLMLMSGGSLGAAGLSLPEVLPLTQEDFAAGVVLTAIGVGETFDFSPPPLARAYGGWLKYGASCDWFCEVYGVEDVDDERSPEGWSFAMGTNRVDKFTVFSFGTIRPSVTNVHTSISPLKAVIGIVPRDNYGALEEENRPSQFWEYLTPSDTLLLTWQNVLLDRDVKKPVSFQAEIDRCGNVTFRYDLSRLPEEVLENLSVGIMNDGKGRVFSGLTREITSLRWRYLDPSRPIVADHDGDGITTYDELFIYDTDPYSVDTDRDGLTDSEEIEVTKTDPTERYSSDPRVIDSVASALGDVDPYSCPNGDGRTAFENVVYTGSPYGCGGEPVSDRSAAVLEILCDCPGRGVIYVGEKMVPFLTGVASIKVAVPRGERIRLKCEFENEGAARYSSSDFCIGWLPYYGNQRGWVLFPYVEATHPCIHMDASEVTVCLNPVADGESADGFTCTWHSDDEKVVVVNNPPRSADLRLNFPRKSVASVRYEIKHPKYLFGESSYSQVCEYCPKIEDGEGYLSTVDYDDGEPTHDSDDELQWCVEHMCFMEYCRERHTAWDVGEYSSEPWPCSESVSNAYVTATNSPSQFEHVLKLHRPDGVTEKYDSRRVHVVVPTDKFHCCDCEEHWSGNASIGYKDRRVNVHCNGAPFVRTTEDCDLSVYGAAPSSEFGDSRVSILTNGATWAEFDYTVFGVSILGRNVDLRKLNELNSDFGLPVVINTNLNNAAEIKLCTDVNLPDGIIRLAFEDAKARMQLWMTYTAGDYYGHEKHVKILDSETCPAREFTIQEWRRLVGKVTYQRETTLQLLAYGRGSAKLFFGYAGGKGGRYLHDEAVQTITAIRPPLMADMNRDGKINETDDSLVLNGRPFRYWMNQCKIDGDVWAEPSLFEKICDAVVNSENWNDKRVNGRYDLINFFPIAVDMEPFAKYWGSNRFSCRITEADAGKAFNCVLVGKRWGEVGGLQTSDCKTTAGQELYAADVCPISSDGFVISASQYISLGSSSCVLMLEAGNRSKGLGIDIYEGENKILGYTLPMSISPVDEMFRFVSIRDGLENPNMDFNGVDAPANCPDSEMKKQDVFFMHGFNVSEEGARNWNREMFKRFWLAGCNARYWGVTWPGDWHATSSAFNGLHYQRDVRQAMMCAPVLARLINTYGHDSVVLGHSLGNMITSEALLKGAKAKTYFMLDAAVASEAYRGELQGASDDVLAKYRPEDWNGYDKRCWTANWYSWFVNDTEDDRRHLGWVDHFKPLLEKDDLTVYNFYSSGDEVFAENDTVPWLASGVFNWPALNLEWPFYHPNLSLDAYPWQKQETFKGVNPVGGSLSAGWGFHLVGDKTRAGGVRKFTIEEANQMMKSGIIKEIPIFNHDVSAMFFKEISDFDKADILASYVPAVSSPAGKVPTFMREDDYFDMNIKFQGNGWGRANGDDEEIQPWLHSDIKNMAYFYVHQAFLKILELGEMK